MSIIRVESCGNLLPVCYCQTYTLLGVYGVFNMWLDQDLLGSGDSFTVVVYSMVVNAFGWKWNKGCLIKLEIYFLFLRVIFLDISQGDFVKKSLENCSSEIVFVGSSELRVVSVFELK